MKIYLSILFYFFTLIGSAQVYKSTMVFEKLYDFVKIDGVAYLDYNLEEKYVDLVLMDTIYHYDIQKTDQRQDDKRFVVQFKKTKDSMLWNLTKPDAFLFAFEIGKSSFWFKALSNCSREDMNVYIDSNETFDMRR